MRERTALESQLTAVERLERELDDAVTLIGLGESENDQASVAEGEAVIRALEQESAKRQVETLLSGEADQNDSYVEVHSGAGGTESQDWTQMLMRMYSRWGERNKFKVEVMDVADGEEAGIKGATLVIKGHNAYGWLKTESGVHRLVRISPFELERAPPHELCVGMGLSGRRRPHQYRCEGDPTAASTPIVRQVPAASTSTRRIQRCASRICPQASWSPARASARSTRTAPPPGRCCAPVSTRLN